ncbi:Arc family DNA-binding protein [Methylobacterium sp. NEAU 140]|uniref:Arc family DNA-binding protein n=1 Tax=Methylobacterium sp. NEAU 140 TaxID=3064945 RepID=UPI002736EB04|nr:Arc family DNA-binding protein [Methylobacterium sp. NEAU 140]MDP4022949.1 Arc family DNA-binding protein [Methylobacterium sp. NEAU 140]
MQIAPRASEQFQLRLPGGMRSRIAERAKVNMRSMNSEIVMIIANALGDEGPPATGTSFPAHPAAGSDDTALAGGPATQAVEMPR